MRQATPLLPTRLPCALASAALFILFSAAECPAQFTFTGAGSPPTEWCRGTNWMPMQTPPDGSTVIIPPGPPIDMFTCGDPLYTLGAVTAQRRVRFWPAMSFLAGGELTDADLAMSIGEPSTINGTLTLLGDGSTLTSGHITSGQILNTGRLRVVQMTFPNHSTRLLDSGATLVNQGRLELETSIGIRGGAIIDNIGTLVFKPFANNIASLQYSGMPESGVLTNRGIVEVDGSSSGFIRTDYDGPGAVRVATGRLEFFNGDHLFEGTSFQSSGGLIMINGNGLADLAIIRQASATGSGSLQLEGSDITIESLSASFSRDVGNGLWFTNRPTDISIGVVTSNGLVSWSQGNLRRLLSGPPAPNDPPNLTIAQGGLWRIGTPVEANGPGFFDSMKALVLGEVDQQADLRLRNGSIVTVEPSARWTMPAPRGLRGDNGDTFIVRGQLNVTPAPSDDFATIARVVVRFEGDGRLNLGLTRLEVNNLITTPNPIEMADRAVFDIAGNGIDPLRDFGEFRLQNRLVAVSGSPRWTGTGRLSTTGTVSPGTTVIQVNDAATLTNELNGILATGGFVLAHTLTSGPEPLTAGARFINAGLMSWNSGEISLPDPPNPAPPMNDAGFRNSGSLLLRAGSIRQLARGTLRNEALISQDVGAVLSLRDSAVIDNRAEYSIESGAIQRSNAVGDPRFVNAGRLRKIQNNAPRTTATLSLPLDNPGVVDVFLGELVLSGPIAQITGASFNATLSGGTWVVGPSCILSTPNRTITTLGAGASVSLFGDWPQLQLSRNDGMLRLRPGAYVARAPFTNTGEIVLEPGATLRLQGSDQRIIQSGGSIDLTTGGTLRFDSNYLLSDRGRLIGSGQVIGGRVVASGGVIAPGSSPGRIEIQADLDCSPAASFEMEVGGPAPAVGYDQVAVAGAVTLAGALRVRLLDGYQPPVGSTFDILTASSLSGAFTSVDLPRAASGAPLFSVSYAPTGVRLTTLSCPADFNADGAVDPDDLSDFITCYFSHPPCPQADLNADGAIDPDDLSDYIALFFSGC